MSFIPCLRFVDSSMKEPLPFPFLLPVAGSPVPGARLMPRSPSASGGRILLRCARSSSSTSLTSFSKLSVSSTTAWLMVIPGAMVMTVLGNSFTAILQSSSLSKTYLTFPAAAMTWFSSFQLIPGRFLNAPVQIESTSSLAPTMSLRTLVWKMNDWMPCTAAA